MVPSIEIIIPAYNAAEYIVETLESACSQTLLPEFVTVVDDSSSDQTVSLVADFSANRAPQGITVRLLSNTGPRGPAAARNTALRAGKTEWVAFLDADDLMQPQQLAVLAAMLSNQPDAVLSFVDSLLFNSGNVVVPSLFAHSGIVKLPAQELASGIYTLGEDTFTELTKTGIFGTSACLMQRTAVEQAGFFDESMMYCEDTDLFLRMALLGPFVFARDILSHKRVHGTNLTHPKNAVFFGRGTVYLLGKMLGLVGNPSGDQPLAQGARQSVVAKQLEVAVQGYLYHASLRGFAQYRAAYKLCSQVGHATAAMSLRHFGRMVWTYMVGRHGLLSIFRS